MGRTKKKQEIWGEVLTDKGYMRVPRALRLKRAELGISNNEYVILLDYLDYYTYSGGQNPYGHLAQVNGVSERTIQKTLGRLARKGLIGRIVKKHPSGRTKGVVFTIDPLLEKLRGRVKDPSPTEGEQSFTYEGEETFTPNTREVSYKKRDSKKSSPGDRAPGGAEGTFTVDVSGDSLGDSLRETRMRYGDGGERISAMPGNKDGDRGERSTVMPGNESKDRGERLSAMPGSKIIKDEIPDRFRIGVRDMARDDKSKDPYNSTRWYNEVFSRVYREASGQPALTGGREYGAARTYFSRLKELNPTLGAEGIYVRATHGACFMLESQLRGGVFGWMHCPPDICMLSSQAQAVDYHLRKTVLKSKGEQRISNAKQAKISGAKGLREKEANYASEEITRIYGELRGLERAKG